MAGELTVLALKKTMRLKKKEQPGRDPDEVTHWGEEHETAIYMENRNIRRTMKPSL